jgi:hypothetical protein
VFHLFDLPAELRNLIYEYALGGYDICLEADKTRHWTEVRHEGTNEKAPHFQPLTSLCQHIYSDFRPFTVSLHTFVSSPRTLGRFSNLLIVDESGLHSSRSFDSSTMVNLELGNHTVNTVNSYSLLYLNVPTVFVVLPNPMDSRSLKWSLEGRI